MTGGWDPSDRPVSWRRRFNSGYQWAPATHTWRGPHPCLMARFARCVSRFVSRLVRRHSRTEERVRSLLLTTAPRETRRRWLLQNSSSRMTADLAATEGFCLLADLPSPVLRAAVFDARSPRGAPSPTGGRATADARSFGPVALRPVAGRVSSSLTGATCCPACPRFPSWDGWRVSEWRI